MPEKSTGCIRFSTTDVSMRFLNQQRLLLYFLNWVFFQSSSKMRNVSCCFLDNCYLTRSLRAVSNHKMQDELGAKSGNWVAGLSTSFPISLTHFEATMQAVFLPEAGSYTALRRLQKRSDEGKTFCRTSECPQIFGAERLSCRSLFDYCQRNCEYTDGYVLVVWKPVTQFCRQDKFAWLTSSAEIL